MAKEATPLVVQDLTSFTRNLGRALTTRYLAKAPSHVELQNLIARAAGYRNVQALKAKVGAAPLPRVALPLSENARRALALFDAEGRLTRWPVKLTLQRMAMWVLWTRFESKRAYNEREVNAILKAAHVFGDHATLRRELVDHRLLTRKSDCSEYRKLPARADDEMRALLTAWRARQRSGSRGEAPVLAS